MEFETVHLQNSSESDRQKNKSIVACSNLHSLFQNLSDASYYYSYQLFASHLPIINYITPFAFSFRLTRLAATLRDWLQLNGYELSGSISCLLLIYLLQLNLAMCPI